jgi:hypothetical protein
MPSGHFPDLASLAGVDSVAGYLRGSSAAGCIDETVAVEDNGEPTPEERVPEEP